MAHFAGLVATGLHPRPIEHCHFVTTTTHKTLRGPRSAMILCKEKFAQQIDKAVFPGLQGGPHEHTIIAKAVCFKEAMKPDFKEYSARIVKNAKALADTLMEQGIKLVSNGTDNHLILIDLIQTKAVGKEGLGRDGAVALEEAGIITNCNTIPFDPSTPFRPSGIRLGTPTLTTRGMKENEMKEVGEMIAKVINNLKDESIRPKIKERVQEMCNQFMIYE